jgi:hypothetical protein
VDLDLPDLDRQREVIVEPVQVQTEPKQLPGLRITRILLNQEEDLVEGYQIQYLTPKITPVGVMGGAKTEGVEQEQAL